MALNSIGRDPGRTRKALGRISGVPGRKKRTP